MIKNERKVPEFLYKYSSFDNAVDVAEHEKRLKAILYDNNIWFSDPSKLNDLFEFMPILNMGKTADEKAKFKAWINESLKQKGMNRTRRREEIPLLFKEFKRNPNLLRDQYCDIIKSKSVYCLSEDPTNILMWAYYADGHKGYCLKFSPSKNRDFSEHIFQVNYSIKYPVIKPWTRNHEETGKQSICTKSIEWEHECEWRLFGKRHGYNEFPPEVLTGVIIGCRMENKYLDMIKKISAKRKFPLEVFYTQPDDQEYLIRLVNTQSEG